MNAEMTIFFTRQIYCYYQNIYQDKTEIEFLEQKKRQWVLLTSWLQPVNWMLFSHKNAFLHRIFFVYLFSYSTNKIKIKYLRQLAWIYLKFELRTFFLNSIECELENPSVYTERNNLNFHLLRCECFVAQSPAVQHRRLFIRQELYQLKRELYNKLRTPI